MFQDASAAFVRPARRPTRGSGLGGCVDIDARAAPDGAGAAAPDDADDDEHAAKTSAPIRSDAATGTREPYRYEIGRTADWILTGDSPEKVEAEP
jgi:hypothetical protein